MLNQFSPSFLLVSGKISSIPFIKNLFKEFLPVSSDRIVELNNYLIGNWYPTHFKDVRGHIKDPKTTVVVGNLIAFVSEKCTNPRFRFTHAGHEYIAPFEINYLSTKEDGYEEPFFIRKDKINNKIKMDDSFNIYHKKINFTNPVAKKAGAALLNPIYNISFQDPDITANVINGPIKIKFNCDDAENNLEISEISGEIKYKGEDTGKVEKKHIRIRKQTLEAENYYLDDPSFKVHEE